jgi:carboxyl-terminal processing protease
MRNCKVCLLIKYALFLLVLFPFLPVQAGEVTFASQYIKVWSLVKYYTPWVVESKPNLDSVFQKNMNTILEKNSERALNRSISSLVKYANSLLIADAKPETDPIKISKIDSINAWVFSDSILSIENKDKLIQIIHLRRDSGSPFYRRGLSRNIKLTNEMRYLKTFPPVEIRLIALAHYWGVINYFFPYKNLIPENWDKVLNDYCIEIVANRNELEFNHSLQRLINQIKDGHGSFASHTIDKYYGYYQLPCEVSYINEQLIITKIHKDAINKYFKFGDRILEIDNRSWNEFYSKDSVYMHGSNERRKKYLSAANFLRSPENVVRKVKLIRQDSLIEIIVPPITRSLFMDAKPVNYCQDSSIMVGENYLYLDLSRVDSIEFEKKLLEYPRPNIIIDLRIYPNLVIDQIADLFVTSRIPHASYSYPDLSIPGLFSPLKMIDLAPRRSDRKVAYEKIYVMVDYTTGSMGEFTCMGFQALPNVITIGDQTAGADGDVSSVILPGNVTTRFSGLSIFYPDGRQTQQCGIKIDKYFHRTGAGISTGVDEGLRHLLDLIANNSE